MSFTILLMSHDQDHMIRVTWTEIELHRVGARMEKDLDSILVFNSGDENMTCN